MVVLTSDCSIEICRIRIRNNSNHFSGSVTYGIDCQAIELVDGDAFFCSQSISVRKKQCDISLYNQAVFNREIAVKGVCFLMLQGYCLAGQGNSPCRIQRNIAIERHRLAIGVRISCSVGFRIPADQNIAILFK